MTSSPLGEMLPRAETIAWPRVPAWSAGAVAARRALKSFAIVRAHRTEGRRERSAEPAPERARVFALSRLFAEVCAAHDWRVRGAGLRGREQQSHQRRDGKQEFVAHLPFSVAASLALL